VILYSQRIQLTDFNSILYNDQRSIRSFPTRLGLINNMGLFSRKARSQSSDDVVKPAQTVQERAQSAARPPERRPSRASSRMSRGSFDSVRREDVGTKERQERQERLNALKESRMEARRVRMETEQEDERKSKEIMKHNSEVGSPRKHTCVSGNRIILRTLTMV
jgi:hypothetical protein